MRKQRENPSPVPSDAIVVGDAKAVLRRWPREFVDLVVTSPPYANSRRHSYGGVAADRYADWFLPVATELHRVLKPQGTLILNIKEPVVSGERHTFVLDIIRDMRASGWLWTEEFIWHKKNSHPGKWKNRFRDSWERCLQFNRLSDFTMYQDQVMVPIGAWAANRLRRLSATDRHRAVSRVNSGFARNVSNWLGREKVYPTNVLHFATESRNRNHSAVFPLALPDWFIQLFTKPGDVVLDPFIGSGTTAVAAKRLGRHYLGIDIKPEYVKLARARLAHEVLLEAEGPPQ